MRPTIFHKIHFSNKILGKYPHQAKSSSQTHSRTHQPPPNPTNIWNFQLAIKMHSQKACRLKFPQQPIFLTNPTSTAATILRRNSKNRWKMKISIEFSKVQRPPRGAWMTTLKIGRTGWWCSKIRALAIKIVLISSIHNHFKSRRTSKSKWVPRVHSKCTRSTSQIYKTMRSTNRSNRIYRRKKVQKNR